MSSEASPAGQDGAVDRISDLPKHIVDMILVLLPLEDAVRTSILSRHWRYAWTDIEQLTFGCDFFNRWTANTVDQVLQKYRGPIHKFILHEGFVRSSYMHAWMSYLSKNNVKEVSILSWFGQLSCSLDLLSCEGITTLNLSGNFFIPPSPTGFPNLRTLLLAKVVAAPGALECLVARCPQLRTLDLIEILRSSSNDLKICSRTLVNLWIQGTSVRLSLENAPSIANLSLWFRRRHCGDEKHLASSSRMQSFDVLYGLSKIQNLELGCETIKIWAAAGCPRMPQLFYHLRYFRGCIDLNSSQDVSAALHLLRRCPLLSTLDIESSSESHRGGDTHEDGILELGETSTNEFPSLGSINMRCMTGMKSEVKFIKYVLSNAPHLQDVRLLFHPSVETDRLEAILKEIIQFVGKGTDAEIIVL